MANLLLSKRKLGPSGLTCLFIMLVTLCTGLACAQVASERDHARLDLVKDRGKVVCATLDDTPGFGHLDEGGNLVGFDIDLCRAVAAAALGDPNAVELRTIIASERGPSVQSGEVDLLVFVTTWTSARDATWGDFVYPMFYDGQGFMVPADLGINSAYELDRAAVCTVIGTTSELNMQDFFRQNRMDFNPTTFEDSDLALDAYRNRQCDAFTTDQSALAALRTSLADPDQHVILPEVISEEPLTPLVPHGDSQWFDIVKSVMSILIYAEAYGVNSANVDAMTTSDDVKVRRLLGVEGAWGQEPLGLDTTVAQTVIKSVGNYAEIYERHLGRNGIGLGREGSRNALWAEAPCVDCPKGGQIYAAPLR